ncbi:MAG: signal recognition particle-docking protein FtsY [Clostridia bacterium]|nr:signal recognition particle-docking protein FtsY [Clostridia bacterium]MDD4686086.1 signal recognition particle-docking protein FtsY [Clostridia bacterium]
MALFKKIAKALSKTRDALKRRLDAIFKRELNNDFFEELEEILITSDIGIHTSQLIIDQLKEKIRKNKIQKTNDARELLKGILLKNLSNDVFEFKYPAVITIVGVNGVGKTTSIGKLAHYFKNLGKEVNLVAGDTFRAAASEQLTQWAIKNKIKIIKQAEGADAAAVVFDGISSAKAKNTDVLIIDTAGRLHTKTNLMQELSKIDRVISREYSEANKYTFIVLDATTGQNALSQIKTFNEYVKLDGVILTKLDGTAKGGVVIAIINQYEVPVVFVGLGEEIDDLEPFDSKDFIDNLF